MRVACILASRSMAGIDGGTNRMVRMILVADSGIARSMAARSRPDGCGTPRADSDSGPTAACVIMKGVVVDHEARMGGVLEHLQQVAQRNVLLHGDDVGSRHHDIVDPALAQA